MKVWVLFALIIISQYALSNEKCQKEQDAVDYWNNSLKVKALEWKREKHREAKLEFLLCLRKPESQTKAQAVNTNIARVKNRTVRTTKIKNKNHSYISISHYTGFTGLKLEAWNKFFVESETCMANKSDMKLFVKCGEERKRYIKYFEEQWDDNDKKLRVLMR